MSISDCLSVSRALLGDCLIETAHQMAPLEIVSSIESEDFRGKRYRVQI